MQTTDHATPKKKPSLKQRLLTWARLTNQPTLKVYHGYSNNGNCVLFGHLFSLSPFPRKAYRQSFVHNTLALIRLFLVKPVGGVVVQLNWQGITHQATTDTDGFFKIDWPDTASTAPGWCAVEVSATKAGAVVATSVGRMLVAPPSPYIIISDIDDTFLISHSAYLRKRLMVLFTQNARSRKPFEGVVRHYQLLATAGTDTEVANPFFYVSSSEWNLYEYIAEFAAANAIPQGVFLLSQLKQFSELLKSGQNNHGTKFARIVRILQAFPERKVILLGDSSQQDPYIYQSIVAHFPEQITAVYIRDVFERSYQKVAEVVASIQSTGTPCLLFRHSKEAIEHSVKIGLITGAEASDKMQEAPQPSDKMA